ncbi:MAG: hypothetical protein V1767_01390 [Chloroflexota bacterium]
MSENRVKVGSPIQCPHCGSSVGGSFSTVVKTDDSDPTEILYKCKDCGKFYSVKKAYHWEVVKD